MDAWLSHCRLAGISLFCYEVSVFYFRIFNLLEYVDDLITFLNLVRSVWDNNNNLFVFYSLLLVGPVFYQPSTCFCE